MPCCRVPWKNAISSQIFVCMVSLCRRRCCCIASLLTVVELQLLRKASCHGIPELQDSREKILRKLEEVCHFKSAAANRDRPNVLALLHATCGSKDYRLLNLIGGFKWRMRDEGGSAWCWR